MINANTNIETLKPFGFAAIADTVTDEIAAAEAKRAEDRRFVRSIVNDVAGTMGIETLDRFHDDEIREGLSSRLFASYSEDVRHSITRMVEPKIKDSPTLKDHMHIISNACRMAINDSGDVGEWDEYLSNMCPEAMKRISESNCQFRVEVKRSLTFIALRLELDALKAAFDVNPNIDVDDDDDLY